MGESEIDGERERGGGFYFDRTIEKVDPIYDLQLYYVYNYLFIIIMLISSSSSSSSS